MSAFCGVICTLDMHRLHWQSPQAPRDGLFFRDLQTPPRGSCFPTEGATTLELGPQLTVFISEEHPPGFPLFCLLCPRGLTLNTSADLGSDGVREETATKSWFRRNAREASRLLLLPSVLPLTALLQIALFPLKTGSCWPPPVLSCPLPALWVPRTCWSPSVTGKGEFALSLGSCSWFPSYRVCLQNTGPSQGPQAERQVGGRWRGQGAGSEGWK